MAADCTPCEAARRRRAAAGARGRQVSTGLEYIVVKAGVKSPPFDTFQAAHTHAAEHGGQVRSRSK